MTDTTIMIRLLTNLAQLRQVTTMSHDQVGPQLPQRILNQSRFTMRRGRQGDGKSNMALFTVTVPDEKFQWDYSPSTKDDWCRETCQGRWEATRVSIHQVQWSFALESDAMLFTLRWK
jgi:hypothetical protein